MNRRNIFNGDSNRSIFANYIYARLISREWFTYSDVIKDFDIRNQEPDKISSSKYYNIIKKAFSIVLTAVKKKEGDDSIETSGNNRNKKYRYTGNSPSPLADELNLQFINNLSTYCEFCQDSAGFFPVSWLEEFFAGYSDLLEIKKKKSNKEQIMQSSIDRQLTNIELLPKLYKAIKNKQALAIIYKPFDEDEQQLVFHPHFLKEYNGRWHLLGHAEGREPQLGYNLALDRIITLSLCYESGKHPYRSAPQGYYSELYKNIVGVSHILDAQAVDLRLRAHTYYIYKLTETKPIHPSQKIERAFGKYLDGEYGEFTLHVEVNKELIGRILMMGAGLEIMSPKSAREEIGQAVKKLFQMYSE